MGVVMPPFDATVLSGGVLATFQVGPDQFRGWFTRQEATDRLVASFQGTAAPISSICTRIRVGPGPPGRKEHLRRLVDEEVRLLRDEDLAQHDRRRRIRPL